MQTCRPEGSPLRRLDERLSADPGRVVLRPFYLAWQAAQSETERARRLVDEVIALEEEATEAELAAVMSDFSDRHWQIGNIFDRRFDEVAEDLELDAGPLSTATRRLIGAYFCHEYSYAAAALMNPSVVPHPDQTGLAPGHTRFVLSMRAVGEGHISSIAFREGIIGPDGHFRLWPQMGCATAMARVAGARPDEDGPVTVERDEDSTLSNSTIFPITEHQRNGLEDLRLTAYVHMDGTEEWIGTYTAYSGHAIRSELIRTHDFRRFTLAPMRGRAARNKGMALFPRAIGGRYAMIGRQDGKNLYLLRSDTIDEWDDEGTLLLEPEFPWELVQIGNCGSPIECDEGWIVLTHGVGPMRKYSLGAVLLDRDDPSKVVARGRCPILTAAEDDREGYVPNVVYTCGAMRVGDELFVPYGIADSAIGFAITPIDRLLGFLK